MKKEIVVCFDYFRTFVPATLCKNLPGYYNISCLDKPGRAGFFPLEGFRMVSLPPFRASLFFKKAPHHAQRNHRAARSPHSTTHATGQSRNHPGQDGSAASSHAKEFCRLPKVNGAASNDFTRFLTFAAIPPAAFSNTLIVNRLASALEVRV